MEKCYKISVNLGIYVFAAEIGIIFAAFSKFPDVVLGEVWNELHEISSTIVKWAQCSTPVVPSI